MIRPFAQHVANERLKARVLAMIAQGLHDGIPALAERVKTMVDSDIKLAARRVDARSRRKRR